MYTITPIRIFAVLLFYAALFVIIRTYKNRIEPAERKTFFTIAGAWAVSVFISNYLLYLAGLSSRVVPRSGRWI